MRGVILGVVLLAAFVAVQHAHAHRVFKKPLAKETTGQLEREAAHARGHIRFFRHHRYGRYAYAFRHRTCFSVPRARRGRCFYVRNHVRQHRVLLAKVEALLAPPITFGALNCLACWDRVAYCETGGTMDWHTNTGNNFYGGLQWLISTWLGYGGGRFAPTPLSASRLQQISIASYMNLSHWPVCGARY